MKIFTHISDNIRICEIKTGSARFHAQLQFDLHSFNQNILSLENGRKLEVEFFAFSRSFFTYSSYCLLESKP